MLFEPPETWSMAGHGEFYEGFALRIRRFGADPFQSVTGAPCHARQYELIARRTPMYLMLGRAEPARRTKHRRCRDPFHPWRSKRRIDAQDEGIRRHLPPLCAKKKGWTLSGQRRPHRARTSSRVRT